MTFRNYSLEELPEILSAKEVAEFLDISFSHVHNLIKDEKLDVIKNIGRVIRIKKSSLLKLLNNKEE